TSATLSGVQIYDAAADAWVSPSSSGTSAAREQYGVANVVVSGIEQTLLVGGYNSAVGITDKAQLFQLDQPDASCTQQVQCQNGQCVGPSGSRTCGPRSCSATSDCGTGYYCDAGTTCVAKLPP